MDMIKITKIIRKLKADGVYLEDIENELDYRDNSHYNWDDNLCEYSTEELVDIEELWCEVA